MNTSLTQDQLACSMLENEGISLIDAAKVLIDLKHSCKEKNLATFSRTKKIVSLGLQTSREQSRSISFAKAVALTLRVKQHRSQRTLQEITTITNRMLRHFPELNTRKMRSIKQTDCQRYLDAISTTPRQFAKVRIIISGIFTVAIKHGYASKNPIVSIPAPAIKEKEIHALSLREVNKLKVAASQPEHTPCQPAMALMLYAGIRPKEVERLTWADISLEDRVIRIKPEHSKTGGARHVTIHKPLFRLLRAAMPADTTMKICPPNWTVKWRKLRQDAGWHTKHNPWQQDCLRHTFASYHIKQFRDYTMLQYEMGHRSLDLLRTRYINLGAITHANAQVFWKQCLLKM